MGPDGNGSHSPGCCSPLCLGLHGCHTPQSACGSLGKRRSSMCTPFLAKWGLCSAWGPQLLSQNKQQSQILSSPPQKGHRQQFNASSPWLVMELPPDTGCAPSRHLPCPSFYLKRPTSTMEAGPTAQHWLVQPQSWSTPLPAAAFPQAVPHPAAKPAENKVYQRTGDISPHLALQDRARCCRCRSCFSQGPQSSGMAEH